MFVFVRCNLQGPLRLRDLAASVRLSPYHFARAFKAATGETAAHFVLRSRIEVAEKLLRDGDRSLADIAFTAGFGGQAHLTSAFRLAKGVTPGRYRRGLTPPRSIEQTTSMEERA